MKKFYIIFKTENKWNYKEFEGEGLLPFSFVVLGTLDDIIINIKTLNDRL